jgi:hypothetical protein
MLQRLTLRNIALGAIVAFVCYGEYMVWVKSPMAQVSAICDNLRSLQKIEMRNTEPFKLIDEASAATLEPLHLITQAVRACDGEAIDIEASDIR